MKITITRAFALCIFLCAGNAAKADIHMDSLSNKQKVLSFYKLIVGQRKAELIPGFVLENYLQHNPTVPQGRAGITGMINYLKTLPPSPEGAKSPIIRSIQEGDLVVTHLHIQFMGKHMLVIDWFKLKDGMLAEHWDAIQEIPDQTGLDITASKGTSEIDETASAENSKRVVSGFYNAIINKQSTAEFIDQHYIEHDPFFYTEKLSPQPQVRLALGLWKLKPLPLRPSLKSSSVPARYRNDFISNAIRTPWSSKNWSPFFSSLSKSRLYDKPEQPPPCTDTRRK
jgi:predicted SnoaL-like aldol condensation-catalyzing enzyme